MKLNKLFLLLASSSLLVACSPSQPETLGDLMSESGGSVSLQESISDISSKSNVADVSSSDEFVYDVSSSDEIVYDVSSSDEFVKDEVESSIIGGTTYHEGLIDPLPQATTSNPIPSGYTLIQVDGGNLSGYREANVVVNIGFNDGPIEREYYSYTNEHGQVIKVIAKEVILQNEAVEPLKSSGRYYHDEAKVPGVESSVLDEGHILADSLGGVANAYNITPQDSTQNRHGDQAEFERDIRDSNGAYDFIYLIEYPDTQTQIPSRYYVEYTNKVSGIRFKTNFNNGDPEQYNQEQGYTGEGSTVAVIEQPTVPTPQVQANDITGIDTNGNGRVTIQEAKDAGFSMPIYSDHWLYQYMTDGDGDGMVGE